MNIFFEIQNSFNITEIASYFSMEIVFVAAFLFNLVLFLIFKRNTKAKRLSDFATSILFAFNTILACGFYFLNINNIQFEVTFLNHLLYMDLNVIFVKFTIGLSLLIFILSIYKLVRTTSYKAILTNMYLSLIGFFSCIIAQLNNDILAFFFLDFVIYLIYKYASSLKLKNKVFYFEFLLLNAAASCIFYIVFFALKFADANYKIAILNLCLFMSYLLKIGIFPCINYFSIQKQKDNLPYSMLLCGYLPFLGIVGFQKIFSASISLGDAFVFSILVFLLLSVFSILIGAYNTKNILKFFSNSALFFAIFVITEFLVSVDFSLGIKLASLHLFAVFSVFSLLGVFKINNKTKKFTLNNFKGLFLKNKKYASCLSFAILCLFSVIPAGVFKNSFLAIKNIYSYDKFGYILFIVFLFGDIILILKSFDIILNCYAFSKNLPIIKYNKKATLNYAAFWISIFVLIITLL